MDRKGTVLHKEMQCYKRKATAMNTQVITHAQNQHSKVMKRYEFIERKRTGVVCETTE